MKPLTKPPTACRTASELAFFGSFFAAQPNAESRTLELFDALPIYHYGKTRRAVNLTPRTKTITLRRHNRVRVFEEMTIHVSVSAAVLKDRAGAGLAIYPGPREELVERAVRKLAVQQVVVTGLHTTPLSKDQTVRVSFTLHQLRRELAEQNHGFKLAELKEALEVLHRATVHLSCTQDKAIHGISSAVFRSYAYLYEDGDESGSGCRVSVDYHPLAAQAIANLAFFPYNYGRVMTLKSPLARWLTTRISHKFRQAKKHGWLERDGYHISLERILNESGAARVSRLRDNVAAVREALAQMVVGKVLDNRIAPEEKLRYATTKGRKKIVDVVWTLFPSTDFCEEIIRGNAEMLEGRRRLGR